MLRPWLAVALFLVLAGCSSRPEAPAAPVPAVTTVATSTPEPVVLTDTLHFLDAPHMAAAAPTGGEPLRVPLKPITPGNTADSIVQWVLPRPEGLNLLTIELRLFIEVEGTYANADPSGGECFWSMALHVAGSEGDTWEILCAGEGPIVQPGIREIHLTETHDITGVGGAELQFDILMATPPNPSAAAFLLTGSTEYDSSLTVAGLQLPLHTRTLLQ